MKGYSLESGALARRIVELLSDKQAEDIVLLNVERMVSFADYFVLATGQNPRHMQSLLDTLDEDLGREGQNPRGREGKVDSGWVLMDFGDVIVHVFSSEERGYYDLEGLWSRAVPVVRIQ